MTEHSRQTHTFTPHNAFRWPGTVELFLQGHRNCTPGNGDTAESCGAKRELLKIREENGWIFDIPRPDLGYESSRPAAGSTEDGGEPNPPLRLIR